MATPLLRSRDLQKPFRHLFYGTCRTSGKLRTRAYLTTTDDPISRYRASVKAGTELSGARYIRTTRGNR